MMRILLPILSMLAICLPVIAFEKEKAPIVLYEGFHIPIQFVETVKLNDLKVGDKVLIAVNEDSGIDDHKIFKEYTKGHAIITVKEGNKHIKDGILHDIYGNKHPVEIKGFNIKDFQEGDSYIIPKGYVIDAFIINKKIYHPI